MISEEVVSDKPLHDVVSSHSCIVTTDGGRGLCNVGLDSGDFLGVSRIWHIIFNNF
jgi:hypothetical protein